ncbi:MBL fold metallo-hydrolase [Corynebacterium uterequi]|uniref:Metal-dependent hydrolase, beta-lactamase superfamily III n=1 Tax=Corynebacterium uterequi TaxID=1072256 RepID=A0A0G3HEI5_9CORY|nr:MBL fold metallo-hydrolase [Corynebacterium uterequi]AKK11751.1 metal-dependent hydrolase, beta-lactamase superfamily III [Corynebacterium uterequi]
MQLTILGCSGSLAAPGNPASGYLLSNDGQPSIVMDLGPGSLAALQQVQNPSDAHVVFSHLHPDHCLDFPSLIVWRRYHPTLAATRKHHLIGPAHTVTQLGRLSADVPDEVDDHADTFDFRAWDPNETYAVGGMKLRAFAAVHPVEAYSIRVEDPATGASLCYSGDTALSDSLVDAARGVGTLLCEAGWGPSSEYKPLLMHLSGAEAGRVAREAEVGRLVLTHLPPWVDPEATAAAAREEFDGEIILAAPGMRLEI